MTSKLLLALVSFSMFACGPDLQIQSASDETDTVESELAVNAASKWFPRESTNSFVFERVAAVGNRDMRLQMTTGSTSVLSGLFAWPVTLIPGTATVVQAKFSPEAVAAPFLRFAGARTWTFVGGGCGTFVITRSTESEPLQTGAGIFGERRTFRFALKPDPLARCAPPAISELSFAAGVGLVSFKTGNSELYVRKNTASGITATASLDKPQYANKPNSIRCIQAPCPSNAEVDVAKVTLTLKNTTTSPVTFAYSNGCFANLVVVNSNGDVMRNENSARSCVMSTGQFTLNAGKSRVITQSIRLEDMSGSQFEGPYSVYASVDTSNIGSFVGSAVLNVGTR
jgi:hypothetical protein